MRKKKPEIPENHERWLVSYADFITLLFAFFVVMFAVSQVDTQKMGRFVESVNVAFEFEGVFAPSSGDPFSAGADGMGAMFAGGMPFSTSFMPPTRRRQKARKAKISRDIKKVIEGSELENLVNVTEDERGITISLAEAGFFASGRARVRAESIAVLDEIGAMFADETDSILVEGHTDNIPIRTARFPSNWELSTSRATSIVSYFIENLSFDPWRMAAAGYGEYRPIADNDTPEGRAQNRRVDIVILAGEEKKPIIDLSDPVEEIDLQPPNRIVMF